MYCCMSAASLFPNSALCHVAVTYSILPHHPSNSKPIDSKLTQLHFGCCVATVPSKACFGGPTASVQFCHQPSHWLSVWNHQSS
jgi:hypothetical protein